MKTITIRDLAQQYPEMYDFHYKWRNTENPELEKDLNEVLKTYGYKLSEEDENFAGNYNDIKGYLNCEIEFLK